MALPSSAEVVKVQVAHSDSHWRLDGLRIHLSNGKSMGALNKREGVTVTSLTPPAGHKIIGFYGASGTYGMCDQFGIVTAPRDVELPDSIYDLPELQNTDGGTGTRAGKKVSFLSFALPHLANIDCAEEREVQ